MIVNCPSLKKNLLVIEVNLPQRLEVDIGRADVSVESLHRPQGN